MRFTIITFLLSSFLLLSCKQASHKQDNLEAFTLEGFEGKELFVDAYFPQTELLPLQLDSNQFIGKVKDICIMEETIFLLDEMTATLYAFDKKSGRCIHAACRRGSGPNEYINPVALSAHSGTLFVLDMPTSRIIAFDKELNAVQSISFDFPAFDFIALDNGFLLYNLAPTEEKKKFVHLNRKGKYVDSFVAPDTEHTSNSVPGGLGKYFIKNGKSEIYAFESYGDKVYKWDNGSLKSIYCIDFAKLNLPKGINKSNTNLFETPYAFLGNIFMQAGRFIPSFFYKSQRYYGFISQSDKSQAAGIAKDNRHDLPFFPQWQCGDVLISIYQEQEQPALVLWK